MVFLEISQNSQGNTCARASSSIKLIYGTQVFYRIPPGDCFWKLTYLYGAPSSQRGFFENNIQPILIQFEFWKYFHDNAYFQKLKLSYSYSVCLRLKNLLLSLFTQQSFNLEVFTKFVSRTATGCCKLRVFSYFGVKHKSQQDNCMYLSHETVQMNKKNPVT